MCRSRYYALVGRLVGAVAVAVVLALVFGVFPRDSDTARDMGASPIRVGGSGPGAPGAAALARNAGPGPGGGPQEGIKVHGHWTIEVLEPDGRLVARQEFDNAFTAGGNTILLELLDGVRAPGSWQIALFNSDGAQNPCGSDTQRAICRVAEPISAATGTNVFKNLVVTRPATGADANKLVLSGSATANFAGAINQVQTFIEACGSSIAPASCGPSNVNLVSNFTATTLGTAVAVQAFQQINATVRISFAGVGLQATGPGLIAFASDRDGNFEIYVMNADGTSQTRLTNDPCVDIAAAWSPDKTKIAFYRSYCPGGGTNQIWVMNADGTAQMNLTNNGDLHHEDPAWCGNQIAYQAGTGGSTRQIWVMSADGTGKRQLPSPAQNQWNQEPTWSPDCTRIAFVSKLDGAASADTQEIWLMNADGTGMLRLTNNSWADRAPSWSPDGTMIAFQRRWYARPDRNDISDDIFLIRPDGTGEGQLNEKGYNHEFPTWSPDGTQIAFFWASQQPGVYIMSLNGVKTTQVPLGQAAEAPPSWWR